MILKKADHTLVASRKVRDLFWVFAFLGLGLVSILILFILELININFWVTLLFGLLVAGLAVYVLNADLGPKSYFVREMKVYEDAIVLDYLVDPKQMETIKIPKEKVSIQYEKFKGRRGMVWYNLYFTDLRSSTTYRIAQHQGFQWDKELDQTMNVLREYLYAVK